MTNKKYQNKGLDYNKFSPEQIALYNHYNLAEKLICEASGCFILLQDADVYSPALEELKQLSKRLAVLETANQTLKEEVRLLRESHLTLRQRVSRAIWRRICVAGQWLTRKGQPHANPIP